MSWAPGWPIVLTLAALASACVWHDYDPVTGPESAPDAASSDVATPVLEASDTSDVADVVVATDATSSLACDRPGMPVQSWTFDTTVQGWTSYADTGVSANLTFAATVGDPSPGALAFLVSPGDGSNQGAWIRYAASLGDLTGRTMAAWVLLAQGTSPHLKVFAQTGSTYAWADSGTLSLQAGRWTCVSLTFSSPAYNQPGYDPTDVITIGFETLAVDSFELFVDSVQIY